MTNAKTLVLVWGFLAVGLWSGKVVAFHPSGMPPQGGWRPGPGVTLGGSMAYLRGEEPQNENVFVPGVEFSVFNKLRSPFFWWLTGGTKMCISTQNAVIPFVEAGMNLLMLNLGIGYGVSVPDRWGRHLVNGFVGLSAPIYSRKRGRLFYIQGYYRPVFTRLAGTTGVSHEAGLMFKWLWAFRQLK